MIATLRLYLKQSLTHFKPRVETLKKITLVAIFSLSIAFITTFIAFYSSSYFYFSGLAEEKTPSLEVKLNEFETWSKEKSGRILLETGDEDQDGLTNYEEYKLGSNPINVHTCNLDKTDGQNLIELMDPANCAKIDFNEPGQVEKFGSFVTLEQIEKKPTSVATSPATADNLSLLQSFGVNSYEELTNFDIQKLDNESKAIDKKRLDLELIKKINNFMQANRSFETYDRNQALPVPAAKYLEVSQKYNTPLKYVLALALQESRYGSDSYDSAGNLNRIGRYKNIYAIGLTDSSSSGFDTWEEGVEAFGKWYTYFQNKGVGDCQKWRIYNPNGDYCAKTQQTASSIAAELGI